MLTENILNLIIRFFVGLKFMLISIDEKASIKSIVYMLIPILFASLWTFICCKALKKDGDYGAPPGQMYMQSQAELVKNKQKYMNESYGYLD